MYIYNEIVSNHGVPPDYGWCRVTFHYIMPNYVIEYIVSAIEYVAKYGQLFLPYYEYLPEKNNWISIGWKHDFPELDYDPQPTAAATATALKKEYLDTQLSDAQYILTKLIIK